MVLLDAVRSSNASIASTLPAGLVAVFVGATNGIGETSLKQFAKHAPQPHVYFLGRSQKAGDRIAAECKALNAKGEFHFMKADVSLIRNVDQVCQEIKAKEKAINLLFLTQGTMIAGVETTEGLHYAVALIVHSRTRFILNLLPLLQNATALRRVVSVFTGTKEGTIDMSDFQGRKITDFLAHRGHASSILTLSLETLAKRAPTVSFIHNFPGLVKSGIARGTKGPIMGAMKVLSMIMGPMFNMPLVEAGDRHVFLATSAKYPPGESADTASGVRLPGGVGVARGTTGVVGAGVYSVDAQGESADVEVERLLARFRKEGLEEEVWKRIMVELMRITGREAI